MKKTHLVIVIVILAIQFFVVQALIINPTAWSNNMSLEIVINNHGKLIKLAGYGIELLSVIIVILLINNYHLIKNVNHIKTNLEKLKDVEKG